VRGINEPPEQTRYLLQGRGSSSMQLAAQPTRSNAAAHRRAFPASLLRCRIHLPTARLYISEATEAERVSSAPPSVPHSLLAPSLLPSVRRLPPPPMP
jgi:hypothetical protein